MYEDIKCPRCGKRYFQVKQHATDFGFDVMPLVLRITPDPIYKDGVLQNPPKPEPVKVRFKCLECGCNFRSETFPNVGEAAVIPNLIDEDLELQNLREKWDSQKPQPNTTDRLTINEDRLDRIVNSKFAVVPNSGTISIHDDTYATKADVNPRLERLEELIDEMSDTMKKRFERVEGSCKE